MVQGWTTGHVTIRDFYVLPLSVSDGSSSFCLWLIVSYPSEVSVVLLIHKTAGSLLNSFTIGHRLSVFFETSSLLQTNTKTSFWSSYGSSLPYKPRLPCPTDIYIIDIEIYKYK